MLLSPVSGPQVMAGEQVVGLAYFALTTLAGLPLLAVYVATGRLDPNALWLFPLFGFTWGCVAGIGATAWAYEPAGLRRWGERFNVLLLVLYLVVGGLAGEHSRNLIHYLPDRVSESVERTAMFANANNPFSLIDRFAEQSDDRKTSALFWLQTAAFLFIGLCLWRQARRLKSHYMETHYSPVLDDPKRRPARFVDAPLSWWAVQRVNKYPGALNIWLACGTAVVYSVFLTLHAIKYWPPWLGKGVFIVLEILGGVPIVTTVLVLLAAVPAAYQYGLWDSNVADRCKRLDELLMTPFDMGDYVRASLAASWSRGRWYRASALLLWVVAVSIGRLPAERGLLAAAAGLGMIGLYFALGFRS
ncbi:MAG: hypothetical protein ACRDD1_01700, partial [Planctomycetia bacterium]